MKRRFLAITICVAIISLAVFTGMGLGQEEKAGGKWAGVDETVVEKFAEAAGRPSRPPYINVGEGDMLLFCFLTAGTIGGFVAGYCFRMLFSEGTKGQSKKGR